MRKYEIVEPLRFFMYAALLGPLIGTLSLVLFLMLTTREVFGALVIAIIMGLPVAYLFGLVPAVVAATTCLVVAKFRSISMIERIAISAGVAMIAGIIMPPQPDSDEVARSILERGADALWLVVPAMIAAAFIGFVGKGSGILEPAS